MAGLTPTFDDLLFSEQVRDMVDSGRYWNCSCFGWHMIVEADTRAEAQRVGDSGVDRFGGIRGYDRCTVRRATADDIASYVAMGGGI